MKRIFSITALFVPLFFGCKEIYDAHFSVPETGYLVVEGFISNGTSPTTIMLSRTTKLKDKFSMHPENGAVVLVESDKNERFRLQPSVAGSYSIPSLSLTPANKYRINITTKDNKNYVSAFTPVRTTPPIDSISWKKENDGLQLYVHAHDDAGKTRFYQWKYDETWEIRSAFVSNLIYYTSGRDNIAVTYKFPGHEFDYSMYRCWQYNKLRNLQIGSTEKLTKDVVYLPLAFIEPQSIKLSVLYSIQLRQYALSAEAYRFYLQMKKNNEQLGSIFDAQPSEANGNIVCTTNPNEIVIGFVDVTQEQVKRIFLNPYEIGGWNYREFCELNIIENISDSIKEKAWDMLPILPTELWPDDSIKLFAASRPECVDCRLLGSNLKPPYWPN